MSEVSEVRGRSVQAGAQQQPGEGPRLERSPRAGPGPPWAPWERARGIGGAGSGGAVRSLLPAPGTGGVACSLGTGVAAGEGAGAAEYHYPAEKWVRAQALAPFLREVKTRPG